MNNLTMTVLQFLSQFQQIGWELFLITAIPKFMKIQQTV